MVSSPVNKPEAGIAPRPIAGVRAANPQPPTERELLTQQRAKFSVTTQTETPEQPPLPQPTARDVLEKKLEMARLAAEIQRESEAYAKRPKKKYHFREHQGICLRRLHVGVGRRAWNASAISTIRTTRAAQQLHGEVLLTVALRKDGTIKSIDVMQSSHHSMLDDAATRIVKLAAPFPPIPTEEGVDELYITRTWQFLPGDVLRNK